MFFLIPLFANSPEVTFQIALIIIIIIIIIINNKNANMWNTKGN
jgi:hypothetical protein